MAQRGVAAFASLLAIAATTCAEAAPTPTHPVPPRHEPTQDDFAVGDTLLGRSDELERLRVVAALPFFEGEFPEPDSETMRAISGRLLRPHVARSELQEHVQAIVVALHDGDFEVLAEFVDASTGLCLRAAKGSACVSLDREELARCGSSKRLYTWPVDTGGEQEVQLTCAEAVQSVFMDRDFRQHARVSFNQFPESGRGNNGGAIIRAPVGRAYVELYLPESGHGGDWQAWHALWLVFSGEKGRMHLVEVTSEYWGI